MPEEHKSFGSAVQVLDSVLKNSKCENWKSRDIYRLGIIKNAVARRKILANSEIADFTYNKVGLTVGSFINSNGEVHIAFKGTGSGEWLDNGKGLSGISEENTYIIYGRSGNEISRKTVQQDYATDQQVEALNWFNSLVAKNNWNVNSPIIVSGHSKGGNKAQFITMHTDLVNTCYSFDGQGFSPEALTLLKNRLGEKFETRRQKIWSLATENDYVNVLGERLMQEDKIYYFESSLGFHYLESMLNYNGEFNPICEQGKLSKYVEKISKEIMELEPSVRQYATLGVMNVFQKYFGK